MIEDVCVRKMCVCVKQVKNPSDRQRATSGDKMIIQMLFLLESIIDSVFCMDNDHAFSSEMLKV